MSTPPTTTNQTPQQLAIMPDWGKGVRQRTVYRTELVRSRRGLEQRTQHRRRPMLAIEYTAEGIHDAAARRRLEAVVGNYRVPLLVPWWPQGARIQEPMADDIAVVLFTNPVADDWNQSEMVFLWHRAHGGEFRALEAREGRNLTLTDEGTHTRFPAGAWCFPVRRAIREKGDEILNPNRHRATNEKLIFRTI